VSESIHPNTVNIIENTPFTSTLSIRQYLFSGLLATYDSRQPQPIVFLISGCRLVLISKTVMTLFYRDILHGFESELRRKRFDIRWINVWYWCPSGYYSTSVVTYVPEVATWRKLGMWNLCGELQLLVVFH
jgi:hypothetical protein